jgi:hypothetical protein
MKTLLSVALGLCLALTLVSGLRAGDKDVTLKGTITCAKCDLHETSKCHTVIKVNENDKDVVYYFADSDSKKYHKPICTEPKKGTVTGTVSEEGGKKIVHVTKVQFED